MPEIVDLDSANIRCLVGLSLGIESTRESLEETKS
jgi:hypothetical protein